VPPKSRRYDLAKTRSALLSQWRALIGYVETLTPSQLAQPSRLPGWSVADLLSPIAQSAGRVARCLAIPEPSRREVDLVSGIADSDGILPGVPDQSRQGAARSIRVADEVGAAEIALTPVAHDRLVAAPWGSMRLTDFLATQLVAAIVFADSLTPEFPHDQRALATVSRTFADVLAGKAPGRSVELRIPPVIVIQCVTGARHTRGTPPSVVQTDPLTWVRLAAGRLSWHDALASGWLSASGERSDLAGYLPLLS